MDMENPYGNKFGLRLQYYFPGLGLAIYQQPARFMISHDTQQVGVAIPRPFW
jgi:hypothetical protein